jgi:hypothetical protein
VSRFLRRTFRLGTAMAVAGLALGLTTTAASAGGNPGVITPASGTVNGCSTVPCSGTNTTFTLTLPQGAGCVNPGPGAFIYGFAVPAGTNLATLSWNSTGLLQSPPGAYDFFYLEDISGNTWSGVGVSSSATGGVFQPTGSLPTNWAWFPQVGQPVPPAQNPVNGSGGIIDPAAPPGTSGEWDVGVSCAVTPVGGGNATNANENYWFQQVCFSAAAGATTANYTWTTNCGGTGANVPEAPLAVGLPTAGAAVLGLAVYVNRRRSRGHPPVASA